MGIIAVSWACNEGFKGQDVPVAKVYDKFLTRSELKELIPRDASREDSLLIAQSYINKWITKELLLHKAQQNLTDAEICPICSSDKRDRGLICVVAEPRDVASIERGHEYNGLYHVLHGVLSPLSRIGPDDLKISELVGRVAEGGVEEVIMALNPDTEGETTSMYISRLLKPFGVRVTRLAYGIPVGSNLEFADDATLQRALEGRVEM